MATSTACATLPRSNAGEPAGPRPAAAASASTPAAEPSSPGPAPKITLAFAGDIHFEGILEGRLADSPESALGPIASVLERADLAMANLETAITTGGQPEPKVYTFRAPPSALSALRAAGIDVATMANNHGMDFGRAGLADSLEAIEDSGLPVVGIGADVAAAYTPHYTTVRGVKIAIVGATQVVDATLISRWTPTATRSGVALANDGRVDRLMAEVSAARDAADLVVVYMHWGKEGSACPTALQRQIADQLIDAGADVIVGAHAHQLLAGGFRRGRYVHYGLGNFAFYTRGGITAQTGVLTLTVQGRKVIKTAWTPAEIRGGIPVALTGSAADRARSELAALRDCANVTATRTPS